MTTERNSMVLTVATLACALGGCQGIALGNVAAVIVTVGLFLGTVQLRRASKAPSAGSATTSVHSAQQSST